MTLHIPIHRKESVGQSAMFAVEGIGASLTVAYIFHCGIHDIHGILILGV
jgi:hypothetical protein